MLGGNLDRLVEALGLDDVEAADELLGVGEGTVGDQRLAVAHAHGLGRVGTEQAVTQQAHATAVHLLDPLWRVLLHRLGDLGRGDAVCADQQ